MGPVELGASKLRGGGTISVQSENLIHDFINFAKFFGVNVPSTRSIGLMSKVIQGQGQISGHPKVHDRKENHSMRFLR